MSGKLMAAGIDVDGWGQGLDVDGFLDPPPNPVLLRSKGGDILFPEVVLVVAGMLKHGRLIFAQSIGGSRRVLLETGSDGSFCLADIPAWARCRVSTSAGYVVDVTYSLFFLEFVFRVDKGLS